MSQHLLEMSRLPGISSGQPFLGQQPTHAGNDEWCAGDLYSQHGHNDAELAEYDVAAKTRECKAGKENGSFKID